MPIAAAMVPGLIQSGAGLLQSVIGGFGARKNEKKLEQMVNNYQPSASIMDYYGKALARYNANPYTSAGYTAATQANNRNLATGLSSAQSRRGGLAAIGGLVQGANDASLRAAATAEQQQAQNLNQLGQATQLKDREDKYKFENKYNLLSMKAGGANQVANSGLQNLYNGLGSMSSYQMAKQN